MIVFDPVGLWVSASKSFSPRFTVSSMTLGAPSTTNGKADRGDDDGSDPWVSGLDVSRNLPAYPEQRTEKRVVEDVSYLLHIALRVSTEMWVDRKCELLVPPVAGLVRSGGRAEEGEPHNTALHGISVLAIVKNGDTIPVLGDCV